MFELAGIAARSVVLAGCIAAGLAVSARAGDAPPDPVFSQLFSRVLADPANVELSLEYARAALVRGEPRKALSTYERLLLQDPGNHEARAGLTRVRLLIAPDFTSWRAEAGLSASSNPRHLAPGKSSGVTAKGALSLRDERRLGKRRWRTLGSVRYDHNTEIDDLMT